MTASLALDYSSQRTSRRFYYGWVNVIVAALAMVATLPGRTQGLGLITAQLLKSVNISADQYSWFNLYATLIGSTFCLACGPLIDRLGARAVLAGTLAALGGTVLYMSRVTTPTQLLVVLILTRGFGQSALSVVSLALVGKWFSRKLPAAMGLFSLLVGVGFVLAFPVVGHNAINHGWRPVWGIIGWSLVAMTAISWLLTRRTPESVGLVVDGLDADAAAPADEDSQSGFTLSQALASPAFWAYALSASLFGMISAGLMLFNESILKEHGFNSHMAVNVITVVVFTGLIANLAGGWLGQKWPVGRLMSVAMFLLALSLVCLPLARSSATVYAYAVLNGVAGGIVTVAFFVCWGKVFGRRHLGSIQGVAQGLTVITSSVGPLLLTQCVARTGSSQPLFYVLAPVVAGFAIFCAIAPAPRLDEGDRQGFEPVLRRR